MRVNSVNTSIPNNSSEVNHVFSDTDEKSGKYSQLDIGDFEEALFSDNVQDEYSVFNDFHEDSPRTHQYVDPLQDPEYARFAGEMEERINSVTDPEMQAIFAEQFEATYGAVSDRLNYQAQKKANT